MRFSLPNFGSLVISCFYSLMLLAQPNLTDNSFGTNGRVHPRFDRKPTDDDLAIDKKNRLLVVTETKLINGDPVIVLKRFNTSGQPDNTFNGNGILVINAALNNIGQNRYEFITKVLFLSDHRITFVIETETVNIWYRLNENGTPDAGFGTNGKRPTPDGLFFNSTTVTNDNKFILADIDWPDYGELQVRKFTTAGDPDNTFGLNGIVRVDLESIGSSLRFVDDILIESGNKIIITGEALYGNTLFVVRLHPNGLIDGEYGDNGFVEYLAESESGAFFYFFNAQLTSDGKLLLSGTDEYTTTAILRLKGNGEPDETFGIDGLLQFQESTRMVFSASPSAGTSTWIGGIRKVNNKYSFLAGKRTNNGSADASFGTEGFVTIDINQHDAFGYITREVDNGKALVMGYGMLNNYYGLTIVQLQTNGNIDNSFGTNGILHITGVYPQNGSEETTTTVAHLIPGPDNSTIYTGLYENGGIHNGSIFIQKLNDNGTPDDLFGTDGLATVSPMYGTAYASGKPDGKIVRQPDGKIVIAYNVLDDFTGYNVMLQRLTSTGQPDNSFGTGGRTLYRPLPSEDPYEEFTILDVKAAPNGKIAVLTMYEDDDLEIMQTPIVQFTANGIPDNSFSGDGKLIPDFTVSKLGYTTDDKLVALGYKDTDPTLCCSGLAIRKYNTNGTHDASFNGANQVTIKYSPEKDEPVALILEPDNAVTAMFAPINSDKDYGIAKFTANGTGVPEWGTNGILTIDGPDNSFSEFWREGLKLDNGGFIFAGVDELNSHFLKIIKTLPNGSPDNSFSGDGLGVVDFESPSVFELAGMFLKPGGKIMVGGNVQDNWSSPWQGLLTQIKTSPTVAATYTMINPGNWSNPSNWQNGQFPPSTIPAGTEVIINPGGNGEATLDVNVIVQTGGKIIIKPGKKLNVASNLTVPSITIQ